MAESHSNTWIWFYIFSVITIGIIIATLNKFCILLVGIYNMFTYKIMEWIKYFDYHKVIDLKNVEQQVLSSMYNHTNWRKEVYTWSIATPARFGLVLLTKWTMIFIMNKLIPFGKNLIMQIMPFSYVLYFTKCNIKVYWFLWQFQSQYKCNIHSTPQCRGCLGRLACFPHAPGLPSLCGAGRRFQLGRGYGNRSWRWGRKKYGVLNVITT